MCLVGGGRLWPSSTILGYNYIIYYYTTIVWHCIDTSFVVQWLWLCQTTKEKSLAEREINKFIKLVQNFHLYFVL